MDCLTWTRSSGLTRSLLSDKSFSFIYPPTPLSSLTLTAWAFPGHVPASKWFHTSVNSGKSSWPQNGHCHVFPSFLKGAALSNSSPWGYNIINNEYYKTIFKKKIIFDINKKCRLTFLTWYIAQIWWWFLIYVPFVLGWTMNNFVEN